MRNSHCIIIFIVCIALFSGCDSGNRQPVLVGLNKPEILSYIETFNAIQDEFKLEVVFDYSPHDLVVDRKKTVDIVIGEWLASPVHMKNLDALDSLISGKGIRTDFLYPDSLRACSFEKKIKLLPLSFTLPMLVLKKGATKDLVAGPSLMTLDELKNISLKFTEVRGEKLTKMGFYPLWSANFLNLSVELFGARFEWDAQAGLGWDRKSLGTGIAFFMDWNKQLAGKPEQLKLFEDSYVNKPIYQLISRGDVYCSLVDSRQFYQVPEEKRSALEYRWLSRDSKIRVNGDVVYIGIPENARHKEGARLFLRWLFLPETQVKLLEINHFKRLVGTYGIAGGFSTIRDITENYIPQHYPVFTGFIPSPESLVFPGILPDKWKDFKDDVLFPWLIETVTENAQTSDLDTKLDALK